jgi:uncharacterized protein (TIGR00369 family)
MSVDLNVADVDELREQLHAINAQSAFNTWAGFEILEMSAGYAELGLRARPELRQHLGLLHAGVTGALIDTACGYAAFTIVRAAVVTSRYDVALYAPANGERFVARARVIKAGRRQIFVSAELFDFGTPERDAGVLIAGGSALLIPLGPHAPRA